VKADSRALAGVRLRPMTERDIPACRQVFDAAQQELYARANKPWMPADPRIMDRLLAHLVASGPDGAWLAAPPGRSPRPLGFGMAVRRGHWWFLSFLFVAPEAQAGGLGRRLLERCMGAQDPAAVRATCVDALQPVSTGLYAGYGLVPRVPLFTLISPAPAAGMPSLPRPVESVDFERLAEDPPGHRRLAATVDELDREVVGHDRAVDHRFWRADGRRGVLYIDRASGAALAYGYRTAGGRIGPVLTRDPALFPGILRDLVEREEPSGNWQILVPGTAEQALVPLLRAGARFDGSPALYAASQAADHLERYLPGSYALP
jgi:GNAT superfamily N-acetyltransferase